MKMNCKKCPYFEKKSKEIRSGSVVLGFCKLRQKFISDMTINKEFCKDKAVLSFDKTKKSVFR